MENRTCFWRGTLGLALVVVGRITPVCATVIDTISTWNGIYNINSFGEGTTPTYGQTVTVPTDNVLDSFTFKLLQGGGDPTTIRFCVMAWDGEKVSGPVLFQTGPTTLTQFTTLYQDYRIDTGGLPLVAGNQYALFFTSLLDNDSINDASFAAAHHYSEDPYTGGVFILNNESLSFAALSSTAWQANFLNMSDLAFRAEFSSLPSGDFNNDGAIDGADYVVWRKGLGTTYTQNDYNVWRAHFGQPGSGSVANTNAAVPEPATLVLFVFALVCRCPRRCRAA